MTNFRLFQTEQVRRRQYEFDEKGGNFSKIGRIHCREKEILLLQILDSFRLNKFADDNLNLMKRAEISPKLVVNTVGKREIAHNEQFSFFPPQYFQKTYTEDIIRVCFEKG